MDNVITTWDSMDTIIGSNILRLEKKLATAQDSNRRLERLQVKKQKIMEVSDKLVSVCMKLKFTERVIQKEEANYRNRRKAFFDDTITESLLETFPNECFQADLAFDFSRKKHKVKLLLHHYDSITGKMNDRAPYISEGKLLQYVISLSATTSITRGLGCNTLYVDEAFAVAAKDKLPELGALLYKKTIESKMQCILISQDSTLYADLPRVEFHLEKDYKENKTIISKVEFH